MELVYNKPSHQVTTYATIPSTRATLAAIIAISEPPTVPPMPAGLAQSPHNTPEGVTAKGTTPPRRPGPAPGDRVDKRAWDRPQHDPLALGIGPAGSGRSPAQGANRTEPQHCQHTVAREDPAGQAHHDTRMSWGAPPRQTTRCYSPPRARRPRKITLR